MVFMTTLYGFPTNNIKEFHPNFSLSGIYQAHWNIIEFIDICEKSPIFGPNNFEDILWQSFKHEKSITDKNCQRNQNS